jgi:HAD superfamily hydrolase (TIGR01509 family)
VGAGQSSRRRPALADLDAVTLDAYGTLLTLRDPVGSLGRLLPDRSPTEIEHAFSKEASYYIPRSFLGRDEASLARLYVECTAVFNEAIGAELTTEQYVGALEYEQVPRAFEAVERLRRLGLAIAVVANWDCTLPKRLPTDWTVVTSAEAGAPKPDPEPFRLAHDRLGVAPARALHVGDSPADEEGARAAGLHFLPAPVASIVEGWS